MNFVESKKIALCFVCLGNICRSPTAEGVFTKLAGQAGLLEHLLIESAGTAAYHAGEPADKRSRLAAQGRGYRLTGVARQFLTEDFERFDYVLAMDSENLNNLRKLQDAPSHSVRLELFRDFDPASPVGSSVPDPYYGGEGGFEEVLDQCERASRGLIEKLLSSNPSFS